jgi:DnaJ family protein A protein 2
MECRYEILVDADSRAIYDERGMAGITGGAGPGTPADIFSEFFGGGGFHFDFAAGPTASGARRKKGRDSVIPYEVTLEDLYNGKSVKMNMEKDVPCAACAGYEGASVMSSLHSEASR